MCAFYLKDFLSRRYQPLVFFHLNGFYIRLILTDSGNETNLSFNEFQSALHKAEWTSFVRNGECVLFQYMYVLWIKWLYFATTTVAANLWFNIFVSPWIHRLNLLLLNDVVSPLLRSLYACFKLNVFILPWFYPQKFPTYYNTFHIIYTPLQN